MQGSFSHADPRVPGGRYLSGYWQQQYTVEAMWSEADIRGFTWVRARWADGHVTEHCTLWDARRDQVISGG